MRIIILSVFGLLFFTACTGTQSGRIRDINTYGKNGFPVYEELTPFEYETVVAAKKELPPETLLKLSFFLTDDLRDGEKAQDLLLIYRDFLADNSAKITAVTDMKERGRLLLTLMHTELMGSSEEEAKKYVTDQTSVPKLLADEVFNCNSSAVLYGILAAHFGFTVEGVAMENHAFIQLKHTSFSDPIEVETTSPTGYGKVHDLAFYTEARKLSPAVWPEATVSLERYKKRTFFPLEDFVLIQYKINHDVTQDKNIVDYRRRSEISGYLSDNAEILIDRTRSWYNIYVDLSAKYQEGELLPFFNLIGGELARSEAVCGTDAEFKKLAGYLYLFAAREHALSMSGDGLAASISYAYKLLDPQAPDYENQKKQLLYTIDRYLRKIVESEQIEATVPLANKVISMIPDPATRQGVIATFYYHAGTETFEKEQWAKAAWAYRKCSEIPESTFYLTCLGNAQISYSNWAITDFNNKDYSSARGLLKQCLDYFPDSQKCKETQEELKEAR